MAQEKILEKQEFYRIRQDFIKENGRLNFAKLVAYFKDSPDFQPVGELTLRKWNERIGGDRVVNPELERELFIKKIKPIAESGRNANITKIYKEMVFPATKEDVSGIGYADIARDSEEFVRNLRDEIKEYGSFCPVCGKPYSVPDEVRNNQVN